MNCQPLLATRIVVQTSLLHAGRGAGECYLRQCADASPSRIFAALACSNDRCDKIGRSVANIRGGVSLVTLAKLAAAWRVLSGSTLLVAQRGIGSTAPD